MPLWEHGAHKIATKKLISIAPRDDPRAGSVALDAQAHGTPAHHGFGT